MEKTSYEQLVSNWSEGRKKWQDYTFEVSHIVAIILNKLKEELNISDDKYLKVFPNSEQDEKKRENTVYSIPGCVEFKNDGWATVGIRLLLEKSPMTFPKQSCLMLLWVKRSHDNWFVSFEEENLDNVKVTLSKEPKDEEISHVIEQFNEILKVQTINSLEKWLGEI